MKNSKIKIQVKVEGLNVEAIAFANAISENFKMVLI
jgi:hypothetical protein